jgi:hypothetical protein
VITSNKAKIPMFMPCAIRESDWPKHAAHANSRGELQRNSAAAKRAARDDVSLTFVLIDN